MALQHFWKLNDNAASTTCVATTGTNGTYARNSSNTFSSNGPGTQITQSQDFNGTSDVVDISAAGISFASGVACSFSCWFNLDTTFGNCFGVNGNTNARMGPGTNTSVFVQTTSFTVPALGTVNWHHLLVARAASNATRVFIDGVESSSGAQTLAITLAPTRLGLANAGFFDGQLAWAKVFNTDESANVADLYAERDLSGQPTTKRFGGVQYAASRGQGVW